MTTIPSAPGVQYLANGSGAGGLVNICPLFKKGESVKKRGELKGW